MGAAPRTHASLRAKQQKLQIKIIKAQNGTDKNKPDKYKDT